MPHENEYEETHLREQLVRLQREYQAAAQPYVDRLVYLESMKAPHQSFTLLTSAEFATACAESWKRFSTPVEPE